VGRVSPPNKSGEGLYRLYEGAVSVFKHFAFVISVIHFEWHLYTCKDSLFAVSTTRNCGTAL